MYEWYFFMTEQIRAAAAAKTDTAGGGRRHGAVAGLSTQNVQHSTYGSRN